MIKIIALLITIISSFSLPVFAANFTQYNGDGVAFRSQQVLRQKSGISAPIMGRQKEIDLGERLYYEGVKLSKQGRNREAITKLNQALDIAMRDNVPFGAMNCLLLLGFSHYNLRELNKAIIFFKEALVIARSVKDIEREKSSLDMLEICYREMGNLSTSRKYMEEKTSLSNKKVNYKAQILKLINLSTEFQNSDRIRALSYAEKAVQLSDKSKNVRLKELSLLNIGVLSISVGNNQKAISYLNQSLALSKKIKDLEVTVYITSIIGEAYCHLGDYPLAIQWLKKSAELQENSKNDDGKLLNSAILVYMYMSMGEYKNAIKHLEISKNICMKSNEYRKLLKITDTYLAICHLLVGNKTIAYELIKNANSSFLIALFDLLDNKPQKTISRLSTAELLNLPKNQFTQYSKDNLAGIYTVLGLAYEKTGDLKLAEHCFKLAIDLTEYQRDEVHINNKNGFLGGMIYPPYNRLTAYEALARISNPQDALVYSEKIKARTFLEIVARKQNLRINIPDFIKTREEQINKMIFNLRKKQEMAILNSDRVDVNNIEHKLNKIKEEKKIFIEHLYEEYPKYASINYPEPLDLSKISTRKNEIILEYLITETKTLGWLIKNHKIVTSISKNISRTKIASLINQYRSHLKLKSDANKKTYLTFDPIPGYKLYQLLIEDFGPYISTTDKLIIVPDKELGLLPFEAIVSKLPKNLTSKDPSDLSTLSNTIFFGDDHNITYSQSASSMILRRNYNQKAQCDKNLFILTDPVFEKTDKRFTDTTQKTIYPSTPNLMSAITDSSGITFSRLKETAWLAEQLSKLFKGKGVYELTGFEANESIVKSMDLSHYRYVVFASHGVTESMVPGLKEPALVLSQFGNKERDDGFLTLTDVMSLNLNCDVAVLTACLTGRGRMVNGEGIMDLARAFQYAGSKSVLASLWSVSEKPSLILTDRFFHYLKNGSDPETSLKNARSDVKKKGYYHPYYWAPFILIGETNN